MKLLGLKTAITLVSTAAMLLAACGDDISGGEDAGRIDAGMTIDGAVDPDAAPDPDAMETAMIEVSSSTAALTEGGATDSFDVTLSAAPGGSIDVTVTSGDTGAVTAAPTTLTFTDANYDTAQTVTLTAVDDDDAADESVTITLSATGLADQTVTAAVSDDEVQAIVVSPASTLTVVEEGAAGTIAVTLAAQPSADVTVAVASANTLAATAAPASLTFTSANWDTAQNVTITGVGDANTIDDTSVVTFSSAGLTDQTVTVTVTDDDSLNISVTPPGVMALTEGGAAGTRSVVLTQQPVGTVVVALSSNSAAVNLSVVELTFDNTNWDTAQTFNVSPVSDDDATDAAATITLSSSGLTSRTVDVTVDDDEVQGIVLTANTLTVSESGSGTFGVRLAANPLASVSVTVSTSDAAAATVGGGATTTISFDASDWSVSKNVAVAGVADDDLAAETVTVTAASGGLTAETVTVTVTDDDTQQLVVSTNTLTVGEGSMESFTVRLAFRPGLASTVTVGLASGNTGVATVLPASLSFDSSDWDVPKSVNVSGVDDADLQNESTTVTVSSAGLTSQPVNVTVTDDDNQGILVTPATPAPIIEGGSALTLNVRLAFDPGGTVVVTAAPSPASTRIQLDGGASTTLTFTSANYSTTQPISVTAVSDLDTRDHTVQVAFTAPSIPTSNVTIQVTDDDVQALILSRNTMTVQEQGATDSFTVRLAFDPVDPVTASVSSSDTGAATTSASSLSFNTSNYTVAQTVDVAGVSDPDLVDEMVTITVSMSGVPSETVAVTVTEDDLQDLIVTAANPFEVTENIGPQDFTVHLAYQPPTTVGVNIASDDTTRAGVSATALLFTTTDYGTPKAVTVSGTTDQNLWDTSTTVRVTSPGLVGTDIPVTVFDDDSQRIVLSVASVSFSEGDTAPVGVSLAFIPYCEQATPGCTETVAISTSDAGAVSIDAASFGFTAANYTAAQTVTLTAEQDLDVNDENVTITFDSDEGAIGYATPTVTLTASVLDKDRQNLQFDSASVFTPITEEGATTQIGVRLTQDPVVPYAVTVASRDTSALTVGTGTLTFTSANYTTYQYVTLTAIADVDLVDEATAVRFSSPAETAASCPGTLLAGEVCSDQSVSVLDNDSQAIQVSNVSNTDGNGPWVEEGGSLTFDVRLQYQPTNTTTVNVDLAAGTASAKLGVSPASIDFTSANYNSVVTVTVTGLDDTDNGSEDLDDHNNLVLTLTTAPAVPVAGREGDDEVVSIDHYDTDTQQVVVTLDPEAFPISMQEGGPTDNFFIALAYPPRDGNSDLVRITAPSAELEVRDELDNGGPSVDFTFTAGNWDQPQEVIVTSIDDCEADCITGEVDDDFVLSTAMPNESFGSHAPAFVPTTVDVHVVDDERGILETSVTSTLSGATRHTKRQNINWASTIAVITAHDVNGNVVMASAPRDDLAAMSVGPTVGNATGVTAPVDAAEIDGNGDVGVFSSDGTDGIVYARYTADLNSELTAPASVVNTDGIDFWPSWNGSEYGLIYRHRTDNNLLFRTVQADGTAGTVRVVTTSTASAHQHPNLHPRPAGGWVVFYTTSTAVRCVRLNTTGAPIIGSDVALSQLPASAFVSSAFNPERGTVLLGYNDPTNGLSAAEVNPELCEVLAVRNANFGGGQLLNTPFVAFNGLEYKLAYDLIDGTIGVSTLDALGNFQDDVPVGAGSRPSIAWAGDRWLLRSEGSVELSSGSFQSHCADGAQNGGEEAVDCGGNDCVPCVLEFSFTSTSGNDLVDGNELYQFFSSMQGLVTDNDSISYLITSPNGGPAYWQGFCSEGNGAWYASTYVDAFLSGNSTCLNPPNAAPLYYMCAGDTTAWSDQGTQSPDSCYNGGWTEDGGPGSWDHAAGAVLVVDPNDSGACELEGPVGGGCSDGSWTLTIRVGRRGFPVADVCNGSANFGGSSFDGDSVCGWNVF